MLDDIEIGAIWSDFAGVITPPLGQTMTRFAARVQIPVAVLEQGVVRVADQFETRDLLMPVDTPLISEAEWLSRIADELPVEYRDRLPRKTIADLWFDGRVANVEWVDHLRALRRRGYFVGLLSNQMPSWDSYWRRMIPVDELFDDVILSFSAGTRKPEPEIYRLATERCGLSGSRCLLIDDTAANCRAAREAGWQAIEFSTARSAIQDVDRLLAVGHPAAADRAS
jgi:putative hydrolase of the HAD superfamily